MKELKKVILVLSFALAFAFPSANVFAADEVLDIPNFVPVDTTPHDSSPILGVFNTQSQGHQGLATAHKSFGGVSLYSEGSQDSTGYITGTSIATKMSQSQSHIYGKDHGGAHWLNNNKIIDKSSSRMKASAKNGGSFSVLNYQSTNNEIVTKNNGYGRMKSLFGSKFDQSLNTVITGDATANTKLKNSGKSSYEQGRESVDGSSYAYQGGKADFKTSISGSGNSFGNISGSQNNTTWMVQGSNFQRASLISNAQISGMNVGTNSSASMKQMNEYEHQITNRHGYSRQSGKTTTSIKTTEGLE